MKLLFTLLLSVLCLSAQAQGYPYHFNLSFESSDTVCHREIIPDTIHSNNIWQIGNPNKTVFKTAHLDSNVLVTDTLHPYPVNDTSIFYIKLPLGRSFYPVPAGSRVFLYLEAFSFYYQLDMDTGEIAKIDMSIDSGHTWTNVLANTLPDDFQIYPNDTNAFSYSTTKWEKFDLIGTYTNTYYTQDSVVFRFTFISDSVDTHKDGWMIDDMRIDYHTEAVPQLTRNNNLIKVYPNPSNGSIKLSTTQQITHPGTVTVYNSIGQQVFEKEDVPPNSTLHLPLPDGTYVLKYTTDDEYAVKKLVIEK